MTDDNGNGDGNPFVRHTDPGTSKRAVHRLLQVLHGRKSECLDIVQRIGPCTRNDVRQQAQDDGFTPRVAETIRRRVTDLRNDGYLIVISGKGNSEVLVARKHTILRTNGNLPYS